MRRDPEQKTWLPNYLCRGHRRGKSVMGKRVSRDEHLNTGELVGKPSCMSETPVTCLQSFLCCGSPCGSHHRNSFRKAFILGVTSTWKSISNECHECINCMYSLTWNQLRPPSLSQLRLAPEANLWYPSWTDIISEEDLSFCSVWTGN